MSRAHSPPLLRLFLTCTTHHGLGNFSVRRLRLMQRRKGPSECSKGREPLPLGCSAGGGARGERQGLQGAVVHDEHVGVGHVQVVGTARDPQPGNRLEDGPCVCVGRVRDAC